MHSSSFVAPICVFPCIEETEKWAAGPSSFVWRMWSALAPVCLNTLMKCLVEVGMKSSLKVSNISVQFLCFTTVSGRTSVKHSHRAQRFYFLIVVFWGNLQYLRDEALKSQIFAKKYKVITKIEVHCVSIMFQFLVNILQIVINPRRRPNMTIRWQQIAFKEAPVRSTGRSRTYIVVH